MTTHELIKPLIDVIIPEGAKEWVLLIWDAVGIYMIAMINTGAIHSLNLWLEVGIKLLTFLGLGITIIIKLRKLFRK